MNDLAPQEDRLELPAAWGARLPPRRGRRGGDPVAIEGPEWLERWRRGVAKREGQLRAALAKRGNAPYAAAAEAYLEGRADPRGAAAIAALMLDYDGRARASRLRPEFDCWLHEHGLPFAVAAAVERLAVDPVVDGSHGGYFGGSSITKRRVFEHLVDHPEACKHELDHGGIAAVRSLLAAADDEEYARVVAAVAAHRDTAPKRIAAMLLLPGEDEWVLEACRDYGAHRYWCSGDLVVAHAASRPEHLAAARITVIESYIAEEATIAAFVGGLGTAALPLLIDTDRDRHHADDPFRRHLYRAIALLPSDEATAYLFARLDRPNVWAAATDAATRFPVRALRVAARLAPTAPAAVRRWLTAAASRVDPALHRHLDDADRAVLTGLLDAARARVPEAAPEELPPLLAAPPWKRKRRKPKPVVIAGLVPPPINRVVWAKGERDTFAGTVASLEYLRDEASWRRKARRLERRETTGEEGLYLLVNAPDTIAAPVADRWRAVEPLGHLSKYDLMRALARFETAVSEQVAVAAGFRADCRRAVLPIANPAAARLMAEAFVRLKSKRRTAVEWLDRHRADAALLLVPDALGADKRARRHAEAALAHLAAAHGPDLVRDAAQQYGDEAVAALDAIVNVDPLEPVAMTIPKPSAWIAPVLLPQVLLAGGRRALPPAAVEHLLTALAIDSPDQPYAGVDHIAEACEPDSLSRFSLALFEQWLHAGAPAGDSWALFQLGRFADDHAVRTLAPLVAGWPGEHQHARAVKGLKVLGAIGTETAMRAVQDIADKARYEAIRDEAADQVAAIADRLGLTAEQLADRLLPDFGLRDDAALVLDYGPRRFFVAFDEQLRPFVTDEQGRARQTPPRPGAKDDATAADDARRRFNALKKDLRTAAADTVKRLEAAMVHGRTWTLPEFREYHVDHPLAGRFARRLLWLADHDGVRWGFRVAEDGTFSDVDDAAFVPASGSAIRLAHPALLEPEHRRRWSALFADYEILQPFEQLHRPVMAFTADELATGRLRRFEGAAVEAGRVLGMTARGWDRSAPGDGGIEPGIARALPGGGFVTVALDPGVYVGDVAEHPVQTVQSVRLTGEPLYGSDVDAFGAAVPTGIDPVAASEALAALARLTGAA